MIFKRWPSWTAGRDVSQRSVDTDTDQLRAVMDDGQLHRYSRTDEFQALEDGQLASDGPADTSGRSSHLPTNSPIVGTLAIIACSPGQLSGAQHRGPATTAPEPRATGVQESPPGWEGSPGVSLVGCSRKGLTSVNAHLGWSVSYAQGPNFIRKAKRPVQRVAMEAPRMISSGSCRAEVRQQRSLRTVGMRCWRRSAWLSAKAHPFLRRAASGRLSNVPRPWIRPRK